MRIRTSAVVIAAAVLLILIFPAAPARPFPAAAAQDRTVFWNRWDTTIDPVNPDSNLYTVTEHYDLTFTGTFHYGEREIDKTNLASISSVAVHENGVELTQEQGYCSQTPGTFCISEDSKTFTIDYYFLQAITDGTAGFDIGYIVHGALRSYSGGDQLWWDSIPADHFGYSIGESTTKVVLPSAYAPRQGVDSAVTYGAPSNVTVSGSTVTAVTTQELGGDDSLEIRVQYPHDPKMATPAFQSSFDSQRNYQENVEPILNIIIVLVSLVIAIGGSLFMYMTYRAKGRDPQVGPVPAYLSDLPSALSPAVVGTLLDERADVRDVMSILIDLAHRGYLVIQEDQTEGAFGIGTTSVFTFKRTDKPVADLKPYETRLLNNIFTSGHEMERTLSSLRDHFYTVIPQIESDLYGALVSEGLFPAKPNDIRNRWWILGGLLVGFAVLAVILAGGFTSLGALMCVPFSVGFVGVVVLIAGQYMPAKTQKGAEEAAKWRAFLEYLRNLEKYQDVKDASVHFDDYMPFAVAFGLDRSWMQRFRSVPTLSVPYWYYPVYLGGPYRGGYVAGAPIGFGGAGMGGVGGLTGGLAHAGSGGVSLDSMSGNLAGGLEHLSSGLTTMLDSASRAMTSRPQSTSSGSSGHWSGGGGSWSGGGFSGGGFSGGGHSGFG